MVDRFAFAMINRMPDRVSRNVLTARGFGSGG